MPKSPAQKQAVRKPSTEPDAEPDRSGLNLVVVRGTVSSPPDVRVLPSDAVLAQLQISTRLESETLSMPVAVWSPAAWVEALEPGDDVVVLGRVRRRFFRAGGAAASRVEVEAEVVARARDRRRVHAAVQRAIDALEVLDE
jgi:single-strand DNA-binding protein